MSRSRSYYFTEFDTEHEWDELVQDGECLYICWGEEVCPTTGRKHLQGYIHFAEGVSKSTVKRRLDSTTVHLGRPRGSAAQNIAYCEKDGVFHEFGERPKQGARKDIDGVREAVESGAGMRRIIASGVGYQALRYGEKILTYIEAPRTEPPEVFWYWGPTGTGKTRAALADASARNDGSSVWWALGDFKWFDGYDGHEAAILDDFRPEWGKLSFLLRLLDRYPIQVAIKGGFRQWRPKFIYITCPKPPQECYLDAGEDIEQLLRRITLVREFTA